MPTSHLPSAIQTVLLLTLAATMLACSEANDPDSAAVGAWHATRLTITDNGTATDALEAGVTITMNLRADGTTSGTAHIPAALDETGLEQDESLAGTWSFDADSTHINFEQQSDTFIRDDPWTYNGATMTYSAAGEDPGDMIEATLARD